LNAIDSGGAWGEGSVSDGMYAASVIREMARRDASRVVGLAAAWLLLGCAAQTGSPGPPRGPLLPLESADLSRFCDRARPCRPATRIRLTLDDGTAFEADAPPAPYVLGSAMIKIIPGDDFFVAGDEENGQLVRLRYLEERPVELKNVVHIHFEQAVISGHHAMMLHVDNAFERPLVYHASLHGAKSPAGAFAKTSTCPVRPKGTAIEWWPDPISSIILLDFRFVDAPRACEYY